jgi:hypothetical protein
LTRRRNFIDNAAHNFGGHIPQRFRFVNDGLFRLNHYLTELIVVTVFHGNTHTGPDRKSLDVGFAVSRAKILRCFSGGQKAS